MVENIEYKKCSNCGNEKPIDQFQFSRLNVRRSNCKKCQNKYDRDYRKKNPDIIKRIRENYKDYLKKYRIDNKVERNEYLKKWGKKNPEKKRDQKYRHYYGIGIEDYNKMLDEQNGVCAICGKSYFGRKNQKYFSIDHCHKTGKIRGLLCTKCNIGIGCFEDNIDALKKAISYLEKTFTGKQNKLW